MLVLEVERGLRGVWAGHRELPSRGIREVSTHSTMVLDGSADLSVICLVFLAKRFVILNQHMAVAGRFGARLAHHSAVCCVCAGAACTGGEGCSPGAARGEASRLALADSRYRWKHGDNGSYNGWKAGTWGLLEAMEGTDGG